MIRVGVWGLGRHARKNVLPALRACTGTEIAGVTTRDAAVGREVAADLGCAYWHDARDMLGADIDAVYLATPVGVHHEQGMRVLSAGKHLWCEKSITESLVRTEELCRVARTEGLSLCETFMYAYHPQFRAVQEHAGNLGAMLSLTCRFGIPPLPEPGYRYTATLGGGALLDVGCYTLHAARRLLGELDALACHINRREVDIGGVALLRAKTGVPVFLDWGYERSYRSEIEVWCERGTVLADRIFSKRADFSPSVVVRDVSATPQVHHVSAADHFVLMLDAFCCAIADPSLRGALIDDVEAQARHLSRLLSLSASAG